MTDDKTNPRDRAVGLALLIGVGGGGPVDIDGVGRHPARPFARSAVRQEVSDLVDLIIEAAVEATMQKLGPDEDHASEFVRQRKALGPRPGRKIGPTNNFLNETPVLSAERVAELERWQLKVSGGMAQVPVHELRALIAGWRMGNRELWEPAVVDLQFLEDASVALRDTDEGWLVVGDWAKKLAVVVGRELVRARKVGVTSHSDEQLSVPEDRALTVESFTLSPEEIDALTVSEDGAPFKQGLVVREADGRRVSLAGVSCVKCEQRK